MMESEERASPPSVSTLLAIGEMALFIEVGTLVPSNPNKYIVPWRDRSLDTNIDQREWRVSRKISMS
jgi:hypothetical protein